MYNASGTGSGNYYNDNNNHTATHETVRTMVATTATIGTRIRT